MERVDSAGVEIVENPARDRNLEWTFRELFIVGGDTEGPASFYRVSANTVDGDASGNLHVLDGNAQRVVVFDTVGRVARIVGRSGGGPGELERPMALAVDPAGEITVLDFGKGGLVRWTADGRPRPRSDLVVPPPPPWIRPALRDSGSGVLVADRGPRGSDGRTPFYLRRYLGRDRVDLSALRHPPPGTVANPECGIRLRLPPVFIPELLWSARGGRVAVNVGPAYDVRIFRGDTLVRRVRRDVGLRSATADAARVDLGVDDLTFSAGPQTCTFDAAVMVDGRGFADHVPWIDAVALSPGGELWVRRRAVGEEGPVDVFGPDGAYRGTLPAETSFPLAFLTEDRIAVARTDSMDVQRVAVMEVRR